jgi:sterol desaturase/sphingolipid hydroxylase (fatty acid hydroxylase superfamily)
MNATSDAIVERREGPRAREVGRGADGRAIWAAVFGTIFGLSAAACLLRWSLPWGVEGWPLPDWLSADVVRRAEAAIGRWSLASATYPLGVVAILLLERRHPADPGQKILSVGLAHDAAWVAVKAIAQAVFVGGYVRMLESFHARALGGVTIDLGRDLPDWVRIAVALVVLDFLRWAQHVLHHQVPALWCIHAVHHAQRELNQFSDYRIHAGEYLVRPLVLVLPMLVLGLPVPQIIAVNLALKWHGLLQHANVRSHLGPLRFLLVTPQSHRIHHSIEARHAGRNYGALLSVWDRLFGTQHRDHREYPGTGIDDPRFPTETALSAWSVLTTPLRQTWYPLRQLGTLAAARLR